MTRTAAAFPFLLMLLLPSIFSAQSASKPSDGLLDVLVWGNHMPIHPEAYEGALQVEIQEYLRRAMAYHSNRPVPSDGEAEMLYAAQITYERRLAAMSDDSTAPELAHAYAESLRPCYEWEGFHDCPEREAQFADDCQAAHPDGPFSMYLPLLAAHRWLCTAEAYEYEQRPADAERSRRSYKARLEVARQRSVGSRGRRTA